MALIECYECEKEISDKAPACPHCGAPKEEQPLQVEGQTEEIPEKKKAPSSEAQKALNRVRFLEIAHELEPEFLRSLFYEVCPFYPKMRWLPESGQPVGLPRQSTLRKLPLHKRILYKNLKTTHRRMKEGFFVREYDELPSINIEQMVEEFTEVFQKWLKRWSLFEEWQLDHVMDCLPSWTEPFFDHYMSEKSDSYPPWKRDRDDSLVEEKRLMKQYGLGPQGPTKWPSLRPRFHGGEELDPTDMVRMRWLVRRKVLGQSIDEISTNESYEDDVIPIQTIDDGIKKAEALVGPLRSELPELYVYDERPLWTREIGNPNHMYFLKKKQVIWGGRMDDFPASLGPLPSLEHTWAPDWSIMAFFTLKSLKDLEDKKNR